ncbi:hypothetical protein [Brevundimonas sp.]|uniref:hypothetical protein n=1 Tax=Brevundimonas sp. TaxID=1871086 RepID=UPI0028B0A14C|nr:hypothetical protein [Brevundimonas sp.]
MTVRPVARLIAEFREISDAEIDAVSGGTDMLMADGTICATNEITRRNMGDPPDEGTTLDNQ